ncbi:MAG: phosphopantetheine-binding protein, partial [Bacteroidota bacterium]
KYPEVSGINPNELTELRTLGEIVDYVGAKGSGVQTTSTSTSAMSPTPVAQPVVETAASAAPAVDNSQLAGMLLEVVSEKTGYPAEMLELSMDMEADLGIDSIKRVEIFGALTQKYPEVSGINPNELTELRTLGEIVDYVGQNAKKKVMS